MSAAADLQSRQDAFLRAVLNENTSLQLGWGSDQAAGMSVYRGNYRSALLGALEDTYERTARYVGQDAFKQASMHHAILHPPGGWTIEAAGAGFDVTCTELFGSNPEVADLAWLEWTMLQLAGAADTPPVSSEAFAKATSNFGDMEWMQLQIELQPHSAARILETNLGEIWTYLGNEAGDAKPEPRLRSPRGCIVSREGEQPVFQMVDADNAAAYGVVQGGASYGEMIVMLAGDDARAEAIQGAAMTAGQMLVGWLGDGLVTGLRT
ncbi:putative DNA-binding domain-containing protein [Erythrobacter sp. MTPC3]|uniref:HvfC/BufC family peptide modification chaperone n=1 Tax=Erythrobacter sp. MTPC3 TaxID=3056564 RepID=UPI0036F443D1